MNVKGTALVSTIRYLTQTHGESGLRQVLTRLPRTDRERVERGFLVSGWYPVDLMMRITRLACEEFGPETARALGAASADYALNVVYKIFFRVGSPQFTMSRATAMFRSYYDEGACRSVLAERGHGMVEVSGVLTPWPEFCERVHGWLRRVLELSGAQNVTIEHRSCIGRGDPLCLFEGRWS